MPTLRRGFAAPRVAGHGEIVEFVIVRVYRERRLM